MARSTYEDFIIKEKIGSGSYGVVFKVVRKIDKQTYAMKEIDLQGLARKVSHAAWACLSWPCCQVSGPQLALRPGAPPRRALGSLHTHHCWLPVCAQEQEECIRETRVLSSLDSDYIIKYYDSFLERVSAEHRRLHAAVAEEECQGIFAAVP